MMQQNKRNFSNMLSFRNASQMGQLERTSRVIASEVAVDENTYYGSIKSINAQEKEEEEEEEEEVVQQQQADYDSTIAILEMVLVASDSIHDLRSNSNKSSEKNSDTASMRVCATATAATTMSEGYAVQESPPLKNTYESSPLPLATGLTALHYQNQCRHQLFFDSLSGRSNVNGDGDALSYTSAADATMAAPPHINQFDFSFPFNDMDGGGPRISSILYATPMGSTTKLIPSDTTSAFKLQLCGTKCLSIFGTLFTAISLTASLGNILRLPTTVFLNGGGTFLLAYAAVAFLIGIPLTFLEITLGQFCQQGTTKLWRAVPMFKGIGVIKLLSCLIFCLYYPAIIVYTLFYLIWSLYEPLPTWQCFTKLLPKFVNPTDSAEFRSHALNELCSKNETFGYNAGNDVAWFGIEIALLLFVWTFILLCVFKNGVSFRLSSTLMVPCTLFIAVTLFIEGIQRNTKGIHSLINIKWEPLLSFNIWYTALIQFFFSSHVGLGNITTCAGRLYPKNNPFWTSVCSVFINVCVGFASTCVLYMWIEDLISMGNVIRIPETRELLILTLIYDVMSRCYGRFGHIWAFMSYLLVIMAGFISVVCLVYTLIVGITVEIKNNWNWWQVSLLVCAACFLCGSCCLLAPNNFNVVRLFDHYVLGKLIITTTILEVFAFVWFYGLESLSNDFEFVLGYKLNVIWKTLWFSIPLFLSLMEIRSWFLFSDDSGTGWTSTSTSKLTWLSLPSPVNIDSVWFGVVGWLIYFCAWLTIAAIAAWQVFSQVDYNLSQKFISCTKPSRNWGPVDPIYRHCWIQWKKQYQATGENDFTLRRRGTRDYTHSVKRGRPIGMQYSVNPPSNLTTLERRHKINADDVRLRYSYTNDKTYKNNANSETFSTSTDTKNQRETHTWYNNSSERHPHQ